MTRRITGAEARDLAKEAGTFEVSGVALIHVGGSIRCVADICDQQQGPLLAAAPALAHSLSETEAERDALAAKLALIRERIEDCDYASRESEGAAFAALREAAK